MRNLVVAAVFLVLAFALFWVLTEPRVAASSALAEGQGDTENGRLVFIAGGCASCHAVPGQPDSLLLGGGLPIASPAGTFVAPNISPDPERGIGNWTAEQFANAVLEGTSPRGRHYYPAFPYTSYRHMAATDVRDLFAYMRTLAPSDNAPSGHDFPLDLAVVRRGMGIWKMLFLDTAALPAAPTQPDVWNRGRYLVEALAHCGECHSPRNLAGAVVEARRHGGGRMPNGDVAPNLTPGKSGLGDWTEDDIAFFLADGTTPEGDVVGGEMQHVIANTSQLPEGDRQAIAVYIKSLAPLDSAD